MACGAVLAAVAVAGRVPALELWRRARFVLPLVLLVGVFLPFVRDGGQQLELGPLTVHEEGLKVFAAVAAKAVIGTVSAVLLGVTTSFPSVLRGLEAMRVPRLFVLIAAFMYRYLFVIVEEVGRMRAALLRRRAGRTHRGPRRWPMDTDTLQLSPLISTALGKAVPRAPRRTQPPKNRGSTTRRFAF